MKNIILLFVLTATLFSCSSDNDTTPQAKVLQKVVFYHNSINERHWNISNGLLTTITLADGTMAEEFIYDKLNRVIKDTKFSNGTISEINTITYNTNNTIKSINSLPYTYNESTRTYAYSYGSNFTIDCEVNADMLAVNFIRTGVNPGEYHMTYSEGNMTSFEKVNGSTTETIKNFHFTGTPVPEGSALYKAILAVARVKSLTDPNFFIDGQVSKADPDGFDKGTNDPYYYNYGAIPDTEGKLLQVGIEVLDNHNNPVSWYPFADYYYE